MQIHFDAKSLEYLDLIVTLMISRITKEDVGTPAVKTVMKMRQKFKPNALVSYLTQRERAFLVTVLAKRQGDLIQKASISDEVDIIQNILDKIS